MLTVDTPMQARWGEFRTIERTRELTAKALADMIANNDTILVPDNGVDVTNASAQLGRTMNWRELQTRLYRANPNLFFEVSNSDTSLRGVYAMLPNRAEPWQSNKVKTYLAGFPNSEAIPEFSIQHYVDDRRPILGDEHGQWESYRRFTHVTRGWRNVLVMLLRQGMLTVSGVRNNFPNCWRDSARWHLSL